MAARCDATDVRRIALALAGASEGSHMGHPDFRVRGRIFATLSADELAAHARVEPGDLDALVAADPAAFAPAWGGRWLRIDLAHVGRRALAAILTDAWAALAPKSARPRTRTSSRRAPRPR